MTGWARCRPCNKTTPAHFLKAPERPLQAPARRFHQGTGVMTANSQQPALLGQERTAQTTGNSPQQLSAPQQSANNPAPACSKPSELPVPCRTRPHTASSLAPACPWPHRCRPSLTPSHPSSTSKNPGGLWGDSSASAQGVAPTSHDSKTGKRVTAVPAGPDCSEGGTYD